MTVHEIRIHATKPLREQPETGHNRWHPDVPPVLYVEPGDEVVIETRDALDGQIGRDSTSADVGGVDIGLVHPLTGAVHVAGAEPGDVLAIEILEVLTDSFGYTMQSPGFGFLREDFSEPFLARWDIADGSATSPDIPGVTIPGSPFMGTIGVAPSRELLERAGHRERVLHGAAGFVDLPDAHGAVPAEGPVAYEGLRTIPPRENAGNVDIKQLTAGTTFRIPVFVDGALMSVGDAHFAQGDCEACGQAIEVRGTLRARLTLQKAADRAGRIARVHFERSTPTPDIGAYLATTGVCVDAQGRNESEDLTLAARNALRAVIENLTAERGFTREQAYTICSVAVDLKVSQVVDVPNVMVSAFLPLRIFD
jgi:formamidase